MLRIFLILLFLTVLQISQGIPKLNSQSTQYPRVSTSSRCSIKDYPFMVAIRKLPTYEHICGGTLIMPSWVLTSATCLFKYEKEKLLVIAGSECLTSELRSRKRIKEKNRVGVAKIVMHPKLEVYNIGLIKLKRKLTESSTVGYVKLANYLTALDNVYFRKCVNSTILGWGYGLNSTNKENSNSIRKKSQCLQCINFSAISSNDDKTVYCQEDSGGPLMCHSIQIGIVKIACLHGDTNSFYTKFDDQMTFIYETTSAGNRICFYFPYVVIISLLINEY